MRERKKTVRVISFFDKRTEALVGEYSLKGVKLKELQNIYHLNSQDLMCDMYPITVKESDFFKKRLDIEFDFKKYNYYVDCYVI